MPRSGRSDSAAVDFPAPLIPAITTTVGDRISTFFLSRGYGGRGGGAVQRSILDGLADVRGGDVAAAVQVGDGAGDLYDAVVGARGEPQPCDGRAQQRVASRVHAAERGDVARRHVRV